MMSQGQFITLTTVDKCGRGKELLAIDERLGQVNLAEPQTVIALLTAIARWAQVKRKKHEKDGDSDTYRQRMGAIVTLRSQAVAALGADGLSILKRAESYENHKAGGKQGGLQELQKGYSHERKDFEASKKDAPGKSTKTAPLGASFVSDALKTAKATQTAHELNTAQGIPGANQLQQNYGADPKFINLLLTKEMSQLSNAEFEEISNKGELLAGMQKKHVHFLRKTERVEKFLTWCENGLFYKTNGVPYSTAIGTPDMYAMDRYGNLITMASNIFLNTRTGGYQTTDAMHLAQHNHSSLNAGADVICAGVVEFTNGYITSIDNASGHYKPEAKNLQKCVLSLFEADSADLSRLTVKVFNKKKQRWDSYSDWRVFVRMKF